MKSPRSNLQVPPIGRSSGGRAARETGAVAPAFTLVEMMITVGLLGFIVIGLTAMFVHTQRAFRAGVTQTDVLEAGRATIDLLTRDLEGITPSGIGNVTNFYSRFEASTGNVLTGSNQGRTNILSCFYFLTQYNRQWSGVGYVVAVPTNNINTLGVGTLYRFENPPGGVSTNLPLALANTSIAFNNAAIIAIDANNNQWPAGAYQDANVNLSTNLTRVCDGVIGLRVLAYDGNGILLTNSYKNINTETNFFPRADYPEPPANIVPEMIEYTCVSNAVPAYVDLELDVLESQTLQRFKGIPNTSAQASYLANQAGAIHVFRRRVAIHNVDLEAYQ